MEAHLPQLGQEGLGGLGNLQIDTLEFDSPARPITQLLKPIQATSETSPLSQF